MTHQIVVTIDAEEKTCGDCKHRWECVCELFEKHLGWKSIGGYRRCPACRRAEVK
jgi:hypothetical protein